MNTDRAREVVIPILSGKDHSRSLELMAQRKIYSPTTSFPVYVKNVKSFGRKGESWCYSYPRLSTEGKNA